MRIGVGLLLLMLLVSPVVEARPLRLGLLQTQSALSLLVAERDGYYKEAGAEVEILLFASSQERDMAVITGNIDAFHAGWSNAIALEQSGTDVAGVSLLLGARPSEHVFAIMASPRSSSRTLGDLEGAAIATSLSSPAEYAVDRLLQRARVRRFRKLDVPQMSLRLQMLAAGQLQAAVLVEPFATLAEQMGARRLADTSSLSNGVQEVLFFRDDVLDRRPEDVKAFLRGFARAVAAVRTNPENYRQLMVDKLQLPESLRETYRMVPLERPVIPQAKGHLEDVISWMRENGLLKAAVTARELIRPGFLTEGR